MSLFKVPSEFQADMSLLHRGQVCLWNTKKCPDFWPTIIRNLHRNDLTQLTYREITWKADIKTFELHAHWDGTFSSSNGDLEMWTHCRHRNCQTCGALTCHKHGRKKTKKRRRKVGLKGIKWCKNHLRRTFRQYQELKCSCTHASPRSVCKPLLPLTPRESWEPLTQTTYHNVGSMTTPKTSIPCITTFQMTDVEMSMHLELSYDHFHHFGGSNWAESVARCWKWLRHCGGVKSGWWFDFAFVSLCDALVLIYECNCKVFHLLNSCRVLLFYPVLHQCNHSSDLFFGANLARVDANRKSQLCSQEHYQAGWQPRRYMRFL